MVSVKRALVQIYLLLLNFQVFQHKNYIYIICKTEHNIISAEVEMVLWSICMPYINTTFYQYQHHVYTYYILSQN